METVLLAPSERAVVDVLFDAPDRVVLEHRTPGRTATLATLAVGEERATPSLADRFAILRRDPELTFERQRLGRYQAAAPDKTLAFVAEMAMGGPESGSSPIVYTCPMHPDVSSEGPGRCPECGMALLPSRLVAQATHGSQHGGTGHNHHGGHGHDDARADQGHHGHHAGDAADGDPAPAGIEWEDDMVAVNRMTTPTNTRWLLIDRATGDANRAIDWRFRVGERVKLRLVNELDSDHPTHHPFRIHGAGRFLVLSRDGVAEPNLAWKDTVLVRTGETVDLLLDITNPGVWMAHCHIAEHHEGGMRLTFRVDR